MKVGKKNKKKSQIKAKTDRSKILAFIFSQFLKNSRYQLINNCQHSSGMGTAEICETANFSLSLFITLSCYSGHSYCLISIIWEFAMTSKFSFMLVKRSLENPVMFKQYIPEFNLKKHVQPIFQHRKLEMDILNTLITMCSIIM